MSLEFCKEAKIDIANFGGISIQMVFKPIDKWYINTEL